MDEVHDIVGINPEISNIFFLGEQTNIQNYYQLADLFVLPSLTEGFSNSLLEAMSCALPVVATKVSGTDQIISHNNNGYLIPPGDVDSLAKAMNQLIISSHITHKLGREARKTIIEQYSLKSIANRYLELYRLFGT